MASPTAELLDRVEAACRLIRVLKEIVSDLSSPARSAIALSPGLTEGILSAIQAVLASLLPGTPLQVIFHDGQVRAPHGDGACALGDNFIERILLGLARDEARKFLLSTGGIPRHENGLPTLPIIIHVGAQPNGPPHCGTLVVLCYAFSVAAAIQSRITRKWTASGWDIITGPPWVSVELTFVDTAPVPGHEIKIDGVQYHKTYRSVPGILQQCLEEYSRVLSLLSAWSAIPYRITFQWHLFSQPAVPRIIQFLAEHRDAFGQLLSPRDGMLGLRAACPQSDCGLVDTRGLRNEYSAVAGMSFVVFHCPKHGHFAVNLTSAAEVAGAIEADTPTRNLIWAMSHLLDETTHHVRVMGADYAGMYQEALLYRPLAEWAASAHPLRPVPGRMPHILYAPLVVDWSGAKLTASPRVVWQGDGDEGGNQVASPFGPDQLLRGLLDLSEPDSPAGL